MTKKKQNLVAIRKHALDFINESKSGANSQEIADKFKITRNQAGKILARLYELRLINKGERKRSVGEGAGGTYLQYYGVGMTIVPVEEAFSKETKKIMDELYRESLTAEQLCARTSLPMYVIRNITKELVEKGKIFSTLQERSNKRLYSAESLKIKNHPLDFTPEESLCRLLDVCVMNGIKASRENARA